VCVVLSRVHSIVRAAWKWQHTLLARRLPKAGQRYGPEGRRVPHRRPVRGNAPWPRPTSRAATHTLCSRSSIHRAACRCKSERAAYCRIFIIFQREVFTTSMQCNRDVISNEVKRDGGLCGQVVGEEGLGQLERAREREGRSASIHASLGSGGNRYGRRMLVRRRRAVPISIQRQARRKFPGPKSPQVSLACHSTYTTPHVEHCSRLLEQPYNKKCKKKLTHTSSYETEVPPTVAG
jgi:hypothetical protein